jgi:BirA family transcriptional regulator, biotin operon repressor / biotin---[acetyl-CoA-carboxylase] ligase
MKMLKPTILKLSETASTNTFTLELLSNERPEEGLVVVADFQSQGKGLDTNTWESERGKNLTFSLVLYPEFAADQQFILNKAISLGIYDFLVSELPDQNITIKWPNDIYIGDKKACGILIQNSVIGNKLDYVVAGIGLNVNQKAFTSNAPNPVSMKMLSDIEYNLDKALYTLLQSIFKRYSQVNSGATKLIENDYQKALYHVMEWHEYMLNGMQINAKITGTNAYGQLLLETKTENIIVCDLKEVQFIL